MGCIDSQIMSPTTGFASLLEMNASHTDMPGHRDQGTLIYDVYPSKMSTSAEHLADILNACHCLDETQYSQHLIDQYSYGIIGIRVFPQLLSM